MSSLSHSFSGKRVLVTGGGRGIGAAIARKFYRDNATVFVIDKDQSLLDNLKKDLPKVHTICVDLLDWSATQAAVSAITPLDHLVNNAGIFQGGSVLTMPEITIDNVLGVNLKAVICVTQAFVNGNIKAGTEKGTTVVNIASIMDRLNSWGCGAYCMSKAGVAEVTRTMALEFSPMSIRVNFISPTFVATDMVTGAPAEVLEKAGGLFLLGRGLLKDRAIEPDDVASSVLFLSSPLSAMVDGSDVLVDAGTFAH